MQTNSNLYYNSFLPKTDRELRESNVVLQANTWQAIFACTDPYPLINEESNYRKLVQKLFSLAQMRHATYTPR